MDGPLLILGSSGMAGHVITTCLRDISDFTVVDVGPRRRVFPETVLCDLRDQQAIGDMLERIKPSAVVNCTGILVRASEERKRESAWINACLPHVLSAQCATMGSRYIHLSTDCVFSGITGPYAEDAFRDGDDFYSRSKSLGEVLDGNSLTIRTSIIGPELRPDGSGLFNWFLGQCNEVYGYKNAFWSGVTTLELARFITEVLTKQQDLCGLVHYSVEGGISKLSLLELLEKTFSNNRLIIPLDKPAIDKRLICTRKDLGRIPPSYPAQLAELQTWMKLHKELYPHYWRYL